MNVECLLYNKTKNKRKTGKKNYEKFFKKKIGH